MLEKLVAGKNIAFDDEGFMVNPDEWDEQVASELAASIGISPLTGDHWKVIKFCRADFQKQGDAPTLRRITQEAGVPTKQLYQLFPKGPAKKVAFIAGLGKPTGCI